MIRSYSPFLATLYDQPHPVGALGGGAHYSVLRALVWPVAGEPARFHDFAVIWDEDHDTRVIPAVEELHARGLLAPVLFVGERKGGLSVLVDPNYGTTGPEYADRVCEVAEDRVDGDVWNAEVHAFGDPATSIINAPPEHVAVFLHNIHVLWQLGTKDRPPVPSHRDLEHRAVYDGFAWAERVNEAYWTEFRAHGAAIPEDFPGDERTANEWVFATFPGLPAEHQRFARDHYLGRARRRWRELRGA